MSFPKEDALISLFTRPYISNCRFQTSLPSLSIASIGVPRWSEMIEYALPFTSLAVGTNPSNTQVVSSVFSELPRLKVSCRSTLPSPRWRKLAARTQFKIHNSLPVPLVSPVPALSILSAFSTLSPVPPVPQFKIPFTLLKVLYRLKKRLSLWCIKENNKVALFYCID